MNNIRTYLFNPFIKLAGFNAFLYAMPFVIVSIILSYFFKGVSDGVLDYHFVESISFVDVITYLIVNMACLIVVFYPLGLILNKGKVRFIDILGTFTYARIPLMILPLFNINGIAYKIFDKLSDYESHALGINWSVFEIFYLAFSVFFLVTGIIWYVYLLYKAFAVSANLKGTKAFISFVFGIIFAEIISILLIHTI